MQAGQTARRGRTCIAPAPQQGPIGVFVHHNTLHAFQHLRFEQAVLEASQLFGAEPYMSEAAYRTELARGRIQLVDIDAVLDSEPDALIFPRLSRARCCAP